MPYYLLLISLFFFGCGSDSGSSSSVVSQNASTPSSLPNGLSLLFNPNFTLNGTLLDGETVQVSYTNLSSGSNYPQTSGNFDISMQVINDSIVLTTDINSIPIELTLNQFIDHGGNGLTDSFTVVAKINDVSQAESIGQFVGGSKPTNENVSLNDRIASSEINGAPTNQEFSDNLIGFAIQAIDDDGSTSIVSFLDGSSFKLFHSDGQENGTYTYTFINGQSANLEWSGSGTDNGAVYQFKDIVELTFDNWYEGFYTTIQRIEDNRELQNVSGRFRVLANTDNLVNFLLID